MCLRQAVQGISDIINTPGLVNRDFSDVRSIMTGMGYAMMGTSIGARRERLRRGGAEGHPLAARWKAADCAARAAC